MFSENTWKNNNKLLLQFSYLQEKYQNQKHIRCKLRYLQEKDQTQKKQFSSTFKSLLSGMNWPLSTCLRPTPQQNSVDARFIGLFLQQSALRF